MSTALAIRGSLTSKLAGVLGLLALPVAALADVSGGSESFLPDSARLFRVLLLQDYNTQVVLAATTMLGIASGFVGTLLLLRKRALLSDTVSHATLPGIALAFILLVSLGFEGKDFFALILGALATGALSVLCVQAIRAGTRLKDDAALAIVLSGFFALGLVFLGFATRLEGGSAAGLTGYIYGKTASMILRDMQLIGAVALVCAVICGLLLKEFTLLCFDADFAASQGWPVYWLDLLLMTLIVVVTVIGIQSVGLILVVAMLVIPAAAARFWTDELGPMMLIAGVIGGASGFIGTLLSALFRDMPAGAIIVLSGTALFVVSLFFGTRRGALVRSWSQMRLTARVRRQHLLRAALEFEETQGRPAFRGEDLLPYRSWKASLLRRILGRAARRGDLQRQPDRTFTLTESGRRDAVRFVRNHRLWETYLIAFADVAPNHVDRDADAIEHVLDPDMIQHLERIVEGEDKGRPFPASPHRLADEGATPA